MLSLVMHFPQLIQIMAIIMFSHQREQMNWVIIGLLEIGQFIQVMQVHGREFKMQEHLKFNNRDGAVMPEKDDYAFSQLDFSTLQLMSFLMSI